MPTVALIIENAQLKAQTVELMIEVARLQGIINQLQECQTLGTIGGEKYQQEITITHEKSA